MSYAAVVLFEWTWLTSGGIEKKVFAEPKKEESHEVCALFDTSMRFNTLATSVTNTGDCYQSVKFHACIKTCTICLKFRTMPPDYTAWRCSNWISSCYTTTVDSLLGKLRVIFAEAGLGGEWDDRLGANMLRKAKSILLCLFEDRACGNWLNNWLYWRTIQDCDEVPDTDSAVYLYLVLLTVWRSAVFLETAPLKLNKQLFKLPRDNLNYEWFTCN